MTTEVVSQHTRGTILVVDDALSVGKLISRMLTESGFAVIHATSGIEALELAEINPGTIDLLLSDVFMKAINGPDLAAKLRLSRPLLPVLLMSGEPQRSLQKLAFPSIQKPFSCDQLLAMIDRLIRPPLLQSVRHD